MAFGFWVKTHNNYSAQCPACERVDRVKHIERMFNGVEHYRCTACGCSWFYRPNETEGQYADAMNQDIPGEIVRRT